MNIRRHRFRTTLLLGLAVALLGLSACATHLKPVSLGQTKPQSLRVIGLPQFADNKRIDVRRENPVYAIIGISAKAVQQVI